MIVPRGRIGQRGRVAAVRKDRADRGPSPSFAWLLLTPSRQRVFRIDGDTLLWAAAEAGEESAEGDEAAAVGDGEDAVGLVGVGVPAEEFIVAGVECGDVVSGGAGSSVVRLAAGAGDVEVAANVEDATAGNCSPWLAAATNTKNPVKVTPQPRRAEVKPFKDLEELERVAIELGEWGDRCASSVRPECAPRSGSRSNPQTGRGGANGDDPAHLHRAQRPRRVRRQDRRTRSDPHHPSLRRRACRLSGPTPPKSRLAAGLPGTPWRLPQPAQLAKPRLASGPRGRRRRTRGPNALRQPSPPGFCSTQTTAGSSPN